MSGARGARPSLRGPRRARDGWASLPEPAVGCRTHDPHQSFILGVAGGKIKVKRPEMNHVPAFPRTQNRVRKTESARASGGHLKSTVPGSLCDLKRQKVGKCSLDNKTEKPLNSRCSAGTV